MLIWENNLIQNLNINLRDYLFSYFYEIFYNKSFDILIILIYYYVNLFR